MRTIISRGGRVGNLWGLLCDCGKQINCRKPPITGSERKCPRCDRKSTVLPLQRRLPTDRNLRITERLIHGFKVGDKIDLLTSGRDWEGPFVITRYDIDPPKAGCSPASYLEYADPDGGGGTSHRTLIAGQPSDIRPHVLKEAKQRVRARRVNSGKRQV
jgi:hypothetical protein